MAINFPASPAFNQKHPASPVVGLPTYTWDGEKWTTTTATITPPDYGFVLKSGDVMGGSLTLAGDPATALQAAPKQYVDAGVVSAKTYADTGDANTLKYTAQTLTAPQQVQARQNIDANTNVRYDVQSLTAPQQVQARANINAAQASVVDAGWTPFPYANGWVDYSAPYGPAGFRKVGNSLVVLKGLVMNGTANPIFTLPVGYRPGIQLLLNVQTSPNVACRIDITTAGQVNHTGGSNGWISLGGICFLAEG